MSLEENNELDNFEKIIISEIEGQPEDMQELYDEYIENGDSDEIATMQAFEDEI